MKNTIPLFALLSIFLNIKSQNSCSLSQLPANLQNGLIAYYPFCGNASDAGPNSYHGTVSNAVLTTDRFGNANSAYSFNATNSKIDITNNFFNPSWTDYTISAWFCTNNSSKLEQEVLNTIPHNSLGFGYNYTGTWQGYCIYSLNSNPANNTWDIVLGRKGSFNSFIVNTWYHTVLVKSGNTWKLYINGILDDTFTNNTSIVNTSTGIRLGSGASSAECFSGKLDDYMFYNRALTPTEITTLYASNVSVAENKDEFQLSLYPNPNNGNFMIEFKTANFSDLNVEITDVMGREIYQSKVMVNRQNNIAFEGGIKGIYFVKISDKNGKILGCRKIIAEAE